MNELATLLDDLVPSAGQKHMFQTIGFEHWYMYILEPSYHYDGSLTMIDARNLLMLIYLCLFIFYYFHHILNPN